jgi:hypothetical protein
VDLIPNRNRDAILARLLSNASGHLHFDTTGCDEMRTQLLDFKHDFTTGCGYENFPHGRVACDYS